MFELNLIDPRTASRKGPAAADRGKPMGKQKVRRKIKRLAAKAIDIQSLRIHCSGRAGLPLA
jgi:hypothetical protein